MTVNDFDDENPMLVSKDMLVEIARASFPVERTKLCAISRPLMRPIPSLVTGIGAEGGATKKALSSSSLGGAVSFGRSNCRQCCKDGSEAQQGNLSVRNLILGGSQPMRMICIGPLK